MRSVILAGVIVLASAVAAAAAPPDSRIDRLERWLIAVDQHEPGTADAASNFISAWPAYDVRTLWVDVQSLIHLMRNPKASAFSIAIPGRRAPDRIRYTRDDLAQLRRLARVAAGSRLLQAGIRDELRQLSTRVRGARARGVDNYVLKRGALLHTDIAIAMPSTPLPPSTGMPAGPQRIVIPYTDGQPLAIRESDVHWAVARLLVDSVVPAPVDRMLGEETDTGRIEARPRQDEWVRRWYRATVANMLHTVQLDTVHVDHARQLFPDDAPILFLSGCLHEAFAAAPVQNVIRTATVPHGFVLGVDGPKAELRKAERFFDEAARIDPAFVEARLRHGRVLGLLDRHVEAIAELQPALATTDPLLQYYGELFSGAEHEALRHFDDARAAYHRATAVNPSAQAPHLALSQLARRVGDRKAALASIQELFAVGGDDPDDPWWTYYMAAGRDDENLLMAVRGPFLQSEPQ